MINKIESSNYKFGKIPGIFHDSSPENKERARELLNFLIAHPEIERGPRNEFTFSIFRDSIVSSFIISEGKSLSDIIQEKAPYIKNHPEQMEILLAISSADLAETLNHRPGL